MNIPRNQPTRSPSVSILSAALIIMGNSIGGGILGVPVVGGLAGALPASIAVAVAWLLMLNTGWILADRLVHHRQQGLDIDSLYQRELGIWGSRLASLIYLLLFHSLLVAFLTGAGSVLSQLLWSGRGEAWFTLLFFVVGGGLVLFGPDLVRKCNTYLVCLLAVFFLILFIQCGKAFDPSHLTYQDWIFLPGTFPVIFCSFGYHNIVPLTCNSLDYDARRIGLAIILGTGLILFFNLAWILAVIGALPLQGPDEANLLTAYHRNQPATVPLAQALGFSSTLFLGLLFSLLAIITSYVAVGLGFIGFLEDLAVNRGRKPGKGFLAALTLLPSLFISLLYPELFLKALNLVGGVCLIILFGIMPALMLRRKGTARSVGTWLLLAVFFLVLILELFQEAGWLQIKPEIDHWIFSIPGLK